MTLATGLKVEVEYKIEFVTKTLHC